MKYRTDELVLYVPGNMPVILSSHHDGILKELAGQELAIQRNIANDAGTRNLVERISEIFTREYVRRPHILIFQVAKNRSSEDMFTLYLFRFLKVIGECFEKWGRCNIFDIHRFHTHPLVDGEYDVWFGTDHKKSVNRKFDIEFARELEVAFRSIADRKLKIYVPREILVEGERFMATGKDSKRRIVTKVISDIAKLLHVSDKLNAIQIEFYKDFFLEDFNINKLAQAFVRAILRIP